MSAVKLYWCFIAPAGSENSDSVPLARLASGWPPLPAQPPPGPGGQSSQETEVHWEQTCHCHVLVSLLANDSSVIVFLEICSPSWK